VSCCPSCDSMCRWGWDAAGRRRPGAGAGLLAVVGLLLLCCSRQEPPVWGPAVLDLPVLDSWHPQLEVSRDQLLLPHLYAPHNPSLLCVMSAAQSSGCCHTPRTWHYWETPPTAIVTCTSPSPPTVVPAHRAMTTTTGDDAAHSEAAHDCPPLQVRTHMEVGRRCQQLPAGPTPAAGAGRPPLMPAG
jgi:hypothetical protein